MKVILTALILLGSIAFLSSCKTQQKAKALTVQDIEALPKVLEFSKSGCRGKCPVFDLTVYEGGHVVFYGRAFTKYEGKASDKLTKAEFTQLQSNCQKANLWQKEKGYGMNIMDIPTTTVHFYERERDKKIQWRMRAPKELPTLSEEVMNLIYARDWVENPKETMGNIMPAGAIDNELIVQLKGKVNAQKWCANFDSYGAKVKRTLSKTAGIYLIGFDENEIEPTEMLEMVRGNSQVVSASFNKKLETRSR